MLTTVFINGILYYFTKKISILEACRSIGIKIPRFCYHEALSIAGNCRMCLVEINELTKPIIACATIISENMRVSTESPSVLKARENILEFLLLNHPLDCPICDQGGECDLQDQALFFGSHMSRNFFNKRGVEDKQFSHIIKTVMSRCIHCTKCVRFGEEVCSSKSLSMFNRGSSSEIGTYALRLSLSELSGNVIDLCPVGALTLKSIAFQVRPWEIKLLESIDLSDSIGSNLYFSYKGIELLRVAPKKNPLINESWITNKSRFYFEVLTKSNKYINLNKTVADCFSYSLSSSILFLVNSDLDLKSFCTLKKASNKNLKLNVCLLNSISKKTNLGFWNNKPTIKDLNKKKTYIFFLINTNLEIENPLLNIRLKAKTHNSLKNFSSGLYYKSAIPTEFARFSLKDLLEVIKGAHKSFSKFFFHANNECIFFANKTFNNKAGDLIKNILVVNAFKFYSISNFCNNESTNFLNFKRFNLKEFKFSEQVFGLNLDDTYMIRKILPFFKEFFWVSHLPSSILGFLPLNSWIKLEISQCPGFYINFEQRIQKFRLMYSEYRLCILKILFYIISIFKTKKKKYYPIFTNFVFNNHFEVLNELKESSNYSSMFHFKLFFFSFHLNLLQCPAFHIYKSMPFKSLIEDPYRIFLQLKFSRTLIKSSQLLREDVLLQ